MRFYSWPSMIIILLLSLTAVNSYGQPQHLTVVTEEWPPYNYMQNGEVVGIVSEVVKKTLTQAGLSYDISLLPWARAYHTALNGKNVLIFTIFKLNNRAGKFQWIKINGLSTEMYLFSPKDRPDIQANTIEQARHYRVGVTRETSTHQFLRNQGFIDNINLFPVASERQNILQADANIQHIDLTTGDRLSMVHWLKSSGYPADYLREEAFLFKEDFYMAFSLKSDKDLVSRVQRAFNVIRENGTLDQILEHYYNEYDLKFRSFTHE